MLQIVRITTTHTANDCHYAQNASHTQQSEHANEPELIFCSFPLPFYGLMLSEKKTRLAFYADAKKELLLRYLLLLSFANAISSAASIDCSIRARHFPKVRIFVRILRVRVRQSQSDRPKDGRGRERQIIIESDTEKGELDSPQKVLFGHEDFCVNCIFK